MKSKLKFWATVLYAIAITGITSAQGIYTEQKPITNSGKGTKPLLRMAASFGESPDTPDYAVVYFDGGATEEFDSHLDAFKLMNTDINVPNLFTITPGGTFLSINALPELVGPTTLVSLGINIVKDGFILFKITDIDGTLTMMRISLLDSETGMEQDLITNREYTVPLPAGDYKNRFSLKFSNMTTDLNNTFSESDDISLYVSNGMMIAEISDISSVGGDLIIMNLYGQTIYKQKISTGGRHEFNMNLRKGVYLVALNYGRKMISKKVII